MIQWGGGHKLHTRQNLDPTPLSHSPANLIRSNLITNEPSNTLADKIQALLQSFPDGSCDIAIISGYFNAKALEYLSAHAHKIRSLSLILGSQAPSQADSKQLRFFLQDPFDLRIVEYAEQLENLRTARRALHFITSSTTHIYTLQEHNLLIHAKLYVFCDVANKQHRQTAIIGSSNFTASGLGLYGNKSNKELNILCDSQRDTEDALTYFEMMKASCQDSTKEVQEALSSALFYHSPRDIFSKLYALLEHPEADLDSDENARIEQGSKAFGLYPFQQKAAKELQKRLKTYKVALCADSVGAGKTLTALGVLSAYSNIVIITPPKLCAQWQSYFSQAPQSPHDTFIADLSFCTHIISYHQAANPDEKAQRLLKHASLIIIDESHNLRNGSAKSHQNQYDKLQANLNKSARLLLLSATPINNKITDLSNQLALINPKITIGDDTLELARVCTQADKALESSAPIPKDYYKLTHTIYTTQSSEIESQLKLQGKNLPKAHIAPKLFLSSVPSGIDFSYEELVQILGLGDDKTSESISFSIYDPYPFLPDSIRESLQDKQLENLGDYTTPRGFLAMSLLKALESSLDAFSKILGTITAYHRSFLYAKELESKQDDLLDEDSAIFPTRLRKCYEAGYITKLSPRFRELCEQDLSKLESILERIAPYNWQKHFARSEKFTQVCKIIDSLGAQIHSQKLLIFSESIITCERIKQSLQAQYPKLRIASITGETKAQEFNANKRLFSPKSQKYTLASGEKPIDILVASDCISEGQNLQDCANLINWDIAFNPVRAIQRIGRIYRIGSSHAQIHIYHFFPHTTLESYIKLESRIAHKTQAAATTTTQKNFFGTSLEQEPSQQARQEAYQALDSKLSALDETKDYLLSPSSVLGSMLSEKNQSHLPNGIFSIARSSPTSASTLAQNLIFAALQDESKKTYYTLYNCASKKLLPSVSDSDCSRNLSQLRDFASISQVDRAEFSSLEQASQDYENIAFLQAIFKDIAHELEAQILSHSQARASTKTRDSGLYSIEKRRFTLIAFLFVNPDFSELANYKAKSL
ncbi:helicase-related protein [Helicobacter canis]|uniref:helicase-related protein n=1 Tax=Helicobacter canis TaxID=29419 RepID=UPI002F922255